MQIVWVRTSVLLTVCWIPANVCIGQSTGQRVPDVESVLKELPRVAQQWNLDDPWFEELTKVPREQLIEALVGALLHDCEFRDRSVRRIAYLALSLHHAERTQIGRQQLILGLAESDPWAKAQCLNALDNALPDFADEIVPGLAAVWVNLEKAGVLANPDGEPSREERRLAQGLLKAFATLRERGEPFVAKIERTFKNPQIDARIRADAVYTMLRILGMKVGLARFEKLDPVGESIVLWTLAKVAVEADASGGMDNAYRAEIEQRYLKGLASESKDVRVAALRGLEVAFGDDFVVVRSHKDYGLNPDVENALENVVAHDTDPELRDMATKLLALDHLERKVESILRRLAEKEGE